MFSIDEFFSVAATTLRRTLNAEQEACIKAAVANPLLIIAGPGTGKTTVLVLRALRHLLVDGIAPEGIAITTFTKKGAQEVRTRWLDWGLPLLDVAKAHTSFASAADQAWLERADLNRCTTGTLDSICEEILGEFRPAGTVTPVLIEGYPANQMLLRAGLSSGYYANKADLDSHLSNFAFNGDPPRTLADVVKISRGIIDRFAHDLLDLTRFRTANPAARARSALAAAYDAYVAELGGRSQLDFALLEKTFLDRVAQGALDEIVRTWRAILVDEYQDTNPLQEAIYFELVRRSGASLTVVGDDDQSLYRFRGATVELFTNFVARLRADTTLVAQTGYLTRNYRSTPEIADFFNAFVQADPAFASARIQPPKPAITPDRGHVGIPVLGMFREDAAVLATDVAAFLRGVFRGGGINVPGTAGAQIQLAGAHPNGDLGDAVVLGHSVNEFGRPHMGNPPKEKFPVFLRRELAAQGIAVFNPRGQSLADQPSVRILLGLLLECIDRSSAAQPHGNICPTTQGLTNVARDKFKAWRDDANAFIATNPAPAGLRGFVDAWAARASQTGEPWPDDWPVLELCFKLITWIPAFREDPEHQVWLEAISRAAAQARLFSPYGGTLRNNAPHDERSRGSVIRDILRPIAEGLVEVDEDLIPAVPRDRLSIMTIHQSKGLEFPLVIVDISSGYATNHRMTAGARFPNNPSNVAELEDDLAPFTAIGPARTRRPALERSFDDLVRLYYVAYSRAQTVLMLVGHEKTITTARTVKNVASGWCRDGSWTWHTPGPRPPTFANRLPLVLL